MKEEEAPIKGETVKVQVDFLRVNEDVIAVEFTRLIGNALIFKECFGKVRQQLAEFDNVPAPNEEVSV